MKELKVGDKVILTKHWCADRAYVGLHGVIVKIKDPKGQWKGGYIEVKFEIPPEKLEMCYLGANVKFPRFGDELRRDIDAERDLAKRLAKGG